MKKQFLALATGLVAAAIVVAVGTAAFLAATPRAKQVDIYVPVAGPAERVLAVNGRIRPRLQVDVRPALGGVVLALPFDVGNRVNQGDVLARIDDAPEAAAISVAQAAVRSQQATLAQARRDLARYEALGEFTTKRDVEQKRLAVEAGERELSRLSAAVVQASELRERRVIRAPFTGIILERPTDPGQAVGVESVIYRLADLSAPEVEAEVDEIYAVEIHTGTEAVVRLPGMRDTVPAKVLHVEPRVDIGTGARTVRLKLDQALPDLPAGLTVTINFQIERRANAITVPRTAIKDIGGKSSVLIAGNDDVIHQRAITFIDWPAERVIVTSGVEAGERILTNPVVADIGRTVRIAP